MKIWDDEWNLITIGENSWGQVKQLVEEQFRITNPKKEKKSNWNTMIEKQINGMHNYC